MDTARDRAGNETDVLRKAGKTLVEGAYETLRREILEGAFAPGTKLRTEELRARYNVSGSTMREALTRLLGETLVTSEGQRGFRVAPASLEDFQDLTQVRTLVETEALRQAIAHGDEAWESRIVASFYRLTKVQERIAENQSNAIDEYEERNRDFHNALIAACPSRWLHHLVGLLFQQSERYRRIALAKRTIPRDLHAEHKAIFDATIARNADLACKLEADHIGRTLLALRVALEPSAEKAPRRGQKAAAKISMNGATTAQKIDEQGGGAPALDTAAPDAAAPSKAPAKRRAKTQGTSRGTLGNGSRKVADAAEDASE